MNDHRFVPSQADSKKRATLAALVCGSLLILPGCKVPCLRGAQPGPATPAYYNLNNGSPFWDPATAIQGDDTVPAVSGDGYRSSDAPGDHSGSSSAAAADPKRDDSDPPETFASIIKAASYLDEGLAEDRLTLEAANANAGGTVVAQNLFKPIRQTPKSSRRQATRVWRASMRMSPASIRWSTTLVPLILPQTTLILVSPHRKRRHSFPSVLFIPIRICSSCSTKRLWAIKS